MVVTVSAGGGGVINQPPVASAGGDKTFIDVDGTGTEVVIFDGSASSDLDGSIVSFEWREGTGLLAVGIGPVVSLPVGQHSIELTVTDDSGATATDIAIITVEAATPAGPIEDLTITTLEFRAGKNEWRIAGTSSIPGPGNTMTLYVGPTVSSSPLLGTANVNNLGIWSFRQKDSLIAPDSTGAISIQSSGGGSWEGITGIGLASPSNTAPTIDSFTATPTSISAGAQSQLVWSTSNVSSVTINNGVDRVVVGVDSSINVTPATTNTYTLVGTGTNGSVSAAVTVTVSASVNQLPIANAGANQSASDGDGDTQHIFTLNGGGASDPDGSIVTYDWSEAGVSIGSGVTANVTLGTGSHTITLVVTDNTGATASDTTLVTLTPNQPPVVIAGADQTVNDVDFSGSEPVTLSESGSFDPDGNIVTFEWREGAVLLGSGPTLTTTLSVGTHTLTLTGTDNGGATTSDTTVVTVTSNQVPVANAGPDQTIVDVGGDTLEIVTFDGSGSADPDGIIVSYSWTKNGTFLGNAATFSVTQPVGIHTVVLTVTDDLGRTSSDTVVVTIEAAPAPGNISPTAVAGPDQTVTADVITGFASVILDGTASFDSDGTISDYEWREGTTLLGTSAVQGLPLNVGVHTITLTVTDDVLATGADTIVVTVNAAVLNQAPVANAGVDQTVTDSDGNGIESVLLNGSGSTDADGIISIYQWSEGATVLGTGATLNATFSSGTAHTVLLTITDNEGSTATDSVIVTVNDVTATPQGSVSISGPTSINRGDDTSFTVSLTNTGSTTLTGVQLSFNINSVDLLKNLSRANIVNPGDIAPGASVSQTWTAQGDREGSGSVTAGATSNGTSLDSVSQLLSVLP
jgi:hypothetical protein